MEPVIALIDEAKAGFLAEYGFPPERIHVSIPMEKVMHRLFAKWLKEGRLPAKVYVEKQGAEVHGMEVRRMTKTSPHVEFYLSAVRDGQVYSSHARIEPEQVGARREVNRNEILIDTDEEEGVSLRRQDNGEA